MTTQPCPPETTLPFGSATYADLADLASLARIIDLKVLSVDVTTAIMGLIYVFGEQSGVFENINSACLQK